MKLTADDYEPGFLERSYAFYGDKPYPPPSEEVRMILSCLPLLRETTANIEAFATDILSTLDELDVAPATFAELMDAGSLEHVALPTPSQSPSDITFDAEYEYQYEYLTDVATIELALQTDAPFHEPFVAWRVDADAGVVTGTTGEFGSLHGDDSVNLLDVFQGVQFDHDEECPIIAGARFKKLPVPGRIARELDDRLSEMRVLTAPDTDVTLSSNPTEFPTETVDAEGSGTRVRKPFAWDADRLLMWYSNPNLSHFDPIPYQIEDGMVVSRTRAHQYRDRELPDTREELIDLDGLVPISSEELAE